MTQHTDTDCQTCQDEPRLTCPDCNGKSAHWCERDAEASRTGRSDLYCRDWDGPECDTCENDGWVACPGCS